ncbi:MAG: hypothetical protein ABSC60_14695 [Acidobacteriota bacterium]|jgi:hypothetical protein
MRTMVFLIALSASMQVSGNPPVIIETKKDVEVTHHEGLGPELRGRLYLDNAKARPFLLKKGHKFQMIKIGQEGGCRIRVEQMEYDLTSCPWLPGFRDQQSDIFQIVTK